METFPQRVLAPGAHFMKLVSRSARHRRRIRGEPAAFRAAVTLVAYSELNALGSLFASVGYGQYHSVLRASRRGEWVDACIAAASSYAGLLVTDDVAMKAKLNYIADIFDFPIRAVRLDEFLHPAEQTKAPDGRPLSPMAPSGVCG